MNHWTRRFLTLLGATCALMLAVTAGSASADFIPPTSNPLTGSNFQGGDGNQADEAGHIDWQTLAGLSPGDNGFVTAQGDPAPDSCFGSPNQKQLNPGGWVFIDCGSAVNPSKDNLLAGWTAVDHQGDTFLYLAFNREAQTGNTYLAFELNQRPDTFHNPAGYDVPCRTDGDLIISYQIQSGGSPPNVELVVHKWTTLTADPATGCALTGSVADANPGPDAQGAVNASSIPNYLSASPANFLEGTFGEAAINLSDFFRTQLEDRPCFNFGSISMESHSSTSFTSDLKDFIGPMPVVVANCAIDVDKQVRVRSGNTPSDPTSDTYADSASAVVGSTFDYKFDVSVPAGSKSLAITDIHDVLGTDTNDPAYCDPVAYLGANAPHNSGDANDNDVVDPGEHWLYTCSHTSTGSDTAASPLHNTVFVTGKVPDCEGSVADCGASADDDASITVDKATPQIETTAQTPVTIGQTIHDTATVSGGSNPTGQVKFELYGPGDPTCKDPAVYSDTQTLTPAGGGTFTATSSNFTTTEPGDYHWIATYLGNGTDASVHGDCGDDGETSHVDKQQPGLTTTAQTPVTVGQTIHDTAHLSGGYSPTGTITFYVYAPSDPSCQGTPVNGAAGDSVTVDQGNGDYSSPNVTTTAAGDYHWRASYSGDSNNESVALTACGDEGETSHVNKDKPELATNASDTTGLGHAISDTAHLSGGYHPSGSVSFTVYGPNNADCSGEGVDIGSGAVDANGDAKSPEYTPQAVGKYRFIASYGGDANNEGVSGECNDPNESVDVVQAIVSIEKAGPDHAYDGDKVTFDITVKNPGSSPVENVVVTDQIQGTSHSCDNAGAGGVLPGPVSGDANSDGKLQATETWHYTCVYTVQHGDEDATRHVVNVATVEGKSEFGDRVGPVSDDAKVLIVHPAIKIDKTGPATAQAGDKIAYTLTVTNPGDESFAESTVHVTDAQCNGDPVTLVGKGGDATPGSLDPGDVWTYTCSLQTAAGESAVHNVASVNGTDQYGKTVSSSDDADTTLTQPAQVVLPSRVTPGSAKLQGPTGCVTRAFTVRVRGTRIASVVFTLDGKVMKRLRKPNAKTFFVLRINPGATKIGVHRLVAKVTFQSGSKTKAKTMRLSFQHCAKKLVVPRFTG